MWIIVSSWGQTPPEDLLQRARAEGGELEAESPLDLDGDGRLDQVVCVAFEDRAVTVVALASGARFVHGGCMQTSAGPPAALLWDQDVVGAFQSRTYRFAAGRPAEVYERVTGRFGTAIRDWDLGLLETSLLEPEDQWVASLVLATTAAVPTPRTWVTWERNPASGPGDAALRVKATPKDSQTVVLTVSATDDVAVPLRGTTPADLLKADHFELWMQVDLSRVQLGFADSPSGPVALWFVPPASKAPPPAVRRVPEGLQLELSHSTLASLGEIPLTVVFSDSDSDAGQERLVSTISVRPSPASPDGRLVMLPSGATAPAGGWQELGPATRLQPLAE